MYQSKFEIKSYEVGLWDHESAGQDGMFLAFGPKRYLIVNGVDALTRDKYSVWFIFGGQSVDENGAATLGVMLAPKVYDPVKSPGRAAFWVSAPEDYYADLYAILRHEKPIHFHYTSASAPPPASEAPAAADSDYYTADWSCGVYSYSLNTGTEPVGEGVDKNAKSQFKKLFKLQGR